MNYPMYMIIFFLILFTIIFYASSSSKIAERKMTMIKYAVIGSVNHHDDILEYYPDKESAVKELEKIFAAYQNGEKTYTL